ncbi:general substrate transporter-11 [Coleophoma crateriformis]|uniref:General substrate transporter-11 n=1 Tax=Coleophoma crateriformis TaxID=565419 RepID=A0A3D8S456_9HELO|nr:general substrate transporter-11 [Coleophoma crateriformis]
MGFFNKKDAPVHEEKSSDPNTPEIQSARESVSDAEIQHNDHAVSERNEIAARTTVIAVALGVIASMGGMVFGYESGQISGFINDSDFQRRFGQDMAFNAARQGTMTGLLSIGALIGCLTSGYPADMVGRRLTISGSAFLYIVGVIIEITSTNVWVQFAIGRLVTGFGVGALSTAVPMYQTESCPKNIRSMVVASYQLAITIGILLSYLVNFGTNKNYTNSAQWRITVGISSLWALILGGGILFMPESPRFTYRQGKHEEARAVFARLAGVPTDHSIINEEIAEIEAKEVEERTAGKAHWTGIFTGPGMLHRTLLGMALQAGQQLTGANFFFYFSTTIFAKAGLNNGYITSIILGAVNVGSTIFGIWIVKRVNRRVALITGALWMFVCFMIFAFVGQFELPHAETSKTAGTLMICFTCFFIFAFAVTWGPMVWSQVAELYPIQYRALCMALATACNWIFNFLISFFTTYITNAINYYYGLVFAGCCLGMAIIVFFFMIETKGRQLEEVDDMYANHINPIGSEKFDYQAWKRARSAQQPAAEMSGADAEKTPKSEAV